MKKYLKFMSREPFSNLLLDDKNMPHTRVDKERNSLRYTHPAEDIETSVFLYLSRLPEPSNLYSLML